MTLKNLRVAYPEGKYETDCVVVGSGAGGSVAAAELVQAGLRVVVMEEGELLSTDHFRSEKPSELIPRLYRNSGAIPFLGRPIVGFSEGRCVGGGTVVNGGIFSRAPAEILDHWSKNLGLDLFRRPQFEKLYEEIEERLGVVSEEIGEGNEDSKILREVAWRKSLKWVQSKRNVINCRNSNRCPTGCPTGAKRSVLQNYLLDATENGAEVFSQLRCTKILKNRSEKYRVLAKDRDGSVVEIVCRYVFLAAGVTQTPFLLRRSGLSRVAGRTLRYHTPLKLVTKFDREVNAGNGTSSRGYIEGKFQSIAATNFRAEYVALSLNSLGRDNLNSALQSLDRMAIYMALVRTDSVARLRASFLSQPIFTHRFSSEDRFLLCRALEEACAVLFDAGAVEIIMPLRGSKPVTSMVELRHELQAFKIKNLEILTVHGMSSCAMGVSPKLSTVNQRGQVWEHEGLYVVDASVLPGSIGLGPQATIMAASLCITRGFLRGNGGTGLGGNA